MTGRDVSLRALADLRADVRERARLEKLDVRDLAARAKAAVLERKAKGQGSPRVLFMEAAETYDQLPAGGLQKPPAPAEAAPELPQPEPRGRGRRRGATPLGTILSRGLATPGGKGPKYWGSAGIDRSIEHEDRERGE